MFQSISLGVYNLNP